MFYTNSTTSQMIGVTGGIVPVPKWSTRQQNISVAATTNVARSSVGGGVGEEDHIDRHLDALTSTDTFRPDEGPDELNSEQLTKLAELTKNRRLNSTNTNTNTSAIVDNRTAANNMTMNTMPTPLACSRSSSLTSLSSFDAKSVHSSVASEYSVAIVAASSTSAAANLQQIVNGGRRKKSSSSSNSSSSSTSCEKNNRNGSDGEETAGEEETEKDDRKRRTLLSSDMPTTVRKSEQERRREVDDSSEEEDNWEEDLTTDSPTGAAESSFIRRSRAQHLQQQQFYRQTAALQQQLVTNSLVPPPVLPPATNKPLPWQQATTVPTLPIDYHQLNSNMSRLNIGQPTAIATTTSSILATKTVNLPISGSPIEQQTPKFLQFQQQQQQVTTVNPMQPASSTVVAPTMSVTYAFMKGQQQPQTTTYNQPIVPIQPPIVAPPALQPQPPRFLSSAPPPTNNQFYMQPAHHMVHQHHHNHHHHQPHLLAPPPSSPIVNPSPSSSALSNDAIHRFYDSTSLSSADPRLKSVNTSPQESVCSHRSNTSVLSIVKNDNMQFMQQPPVYSRNFEKFSALLNKAHMNTRQNRVEIEPEEYGSRDYPAIMMMGSGSGAGGVGPSPLIIGGGGGGPLSSSSSSSSSSSKSQIMANPHRLQPQQYQHQHQPAIMQQLPPQPPIQPPILPWAQSYKSPQINMPLINKTNIPLPPPLLAHEEQNDSTAVDDYEEFDDFFSRNLRPKSELAANAPKIGPNTSLDENDFKPAKNSFKRASLQSLDSVSLSASRQSTVASNNTPTKKKVEVKKTAVVNSKPAPPKPVESSKPPQKSTGISSAPVVNMTRTAQLRASKQQQLKNSIDKNKPQLKTKPTGLNQTSQLDSSRRVSIGSSAAIKRDLNTTKQSTVNVAPKLPVSASKQVISRPTPTTNSTAKQIAKPKLTTTTTTTKST